MSHLESPIVPTVGRIVLVRGKAISEAEPTLDFPAIVTRVWANNCINVELFGAGKRQELTSVVFNSDPLSAPIWAAWHWMEYQVKVAVKEQEPDRSAESSEGLRAMALDLAIKAIGDRHYNTSDIIEEARVFYDYLAQTPKKVDTQGVKESTPLDRVIQEETELASKHIALTNFMSSAGYRGLSLKQQELLSRQHVVMDTYLGILHERIRLMTEDKAA